MDDKALEVARLQIEDKRQRFDENLKRAQRILAVSEALEQPIGIFRKKCPKCDKVLTKDIFNGGAAYKLYSYRCDCGYEYTVDKLRVGHCP